ncbi:MAG: DUF6489 family protein [Alteraurantiacibacter sp.]
MKVHVEIECTPQEAREFMGLPDVEQANAIYVETITKAMQGVTNTEQLEQYAKQLAPMGQMGLKMFQSFVEGASRNTGTQRPKKDD